MKKLIPLEREKKAEAILRISLISKQNSRVIPVFFFHPRQHVSLS